MKKNLGKYLGRYASQLPFIVVVVAALIISWQSLVFVAEYFGMDKTAAVLASVSLDGVALGMAALALRAAVGNSGYSGWRARFYILVFAGLSIMFNAEHASILHQQLIAHILYGVAPFAALVMFEEILSFARNSGRKNGPVGPPEIGGIWWLLFPIRSFKTVRMIGSRHLDKLQGITTANESAELAQDETARARLYLRSKGIQGVPRVGRLSVDHIALYREMIAANNGHLMPTPVGGDG